MSRRQIRGSYREVHPRCNRELWVVKWFDANHGDYTARGRQAIDTTMELVSCGFFVAESDEYVTLSREVQANEPSWRGIMNIPKVNIVSVRKGKVRA